jgi:tetratricopeptide (TPR) repeat protein
MQDNLIKLRHKADSLYQKKRLVEAKAAFLRICKAAPEDAEAWLNFGAVVGLLGEFSEAEAAFRRVLEINPYLPQTYFNLAKLLVLQGRLNEAEACWRTYVGIVPTSVEGQYELANALKDIGRFADSLPFYREALRLSSNDPAVLINYGDAMRLLGRFDDAEGAYRDALAHNPTNADAHLKLAELYGMTHRFDQAVEILRGLLATDPGMKGYVSHKLAVAALWHGDFAKALDYYDEALELLPDKIDLRLGHAFHLLRLGRFEEGWRESEARTRYARWVNEMYTFKFAQPRWDGAPLEGRTILVYAEQGFGDKIQFCRYLPLVTERGGKVLFYCDEELLRLFRRLNGIERVEPFNDKIFQERFDVHIPLMSLPYLFDTRLENIPAKIPYLAADPDAVARWRERMDQKRLNVGLVWSGWPAHRQNYWRSIPARDLAALAEAGPVTFYALQKDASAAGIEEIAPLLDIRDISADLHDFDDTAAVISNLDLVISVDTAVAHLAGALGRPTWTLLHCPPDWRWLTDRDDSPWYPTMRLFRREPAEEWPAVLKRVVSALTLLVAQSGKQ